MELKFAMPLIYTDKTTRYYNLQHVISIVGALSEGFDVNYRIGNVPSFSGLTFSLINMAAIGNDDNDYHCSSEKYSRIMSFDTHHYENKLEKIFKSLQACTIEPQFEVALFDNDNYNTKIDGFTYFDLKNNAYEGVMFIINHVIEESISEMEKDLSLIKIITSDAFTSISVHRISFSPNIYNITIKAYADKCREV